MFSHSPKAIPEEEAGCEGLQVFQGFAASALEEEEEEAAESMCVPVELLHGSTRRAQPVFQQGLNTRWLLA